MISPRFLNWWKLHTPKGVNNSVNALIIVCALREAKQPMSLKELSAQLGLWHDTVRTLVTFLEKDGLLKAEGRRRDTIRRHHYRVYSLSDHLADVFTVTA